MKTSNKILLVSTVLFVSLYFANLCISGQKLREETNRVVTLSGEKTKLVRKYPAKHWLLIRGNFNVELIKDSLNLLEIEADKNILPLIRLEDSEKGQLHVLLYNKSANAGPEKINLKFHYTVLPDTTLVNSLSTSRVVYKKKI